jgi:transcriptional regulator with GAF, ATPase, and Fis domain
LPEDLGADVTPGRHRRADDTLARHHRADDTLARHHRADVDTTARVDAVASALDNLQRRLTAPAQLQGFLQDLCDCVVSTIIEADMAGVTLVDEDGRAETAACTDRRAVDIDLNQYRNGEGPCLEAATTGQIVKVRVDEVVERWPAFAADVRDIGAASYLSAPLRLGEAHAGALNLYSFGSHGFGDLDVALLRIFTSLAEVVARMTREAAAAHDEVAGLKKAMVTRGVIEQAKGILMAAERISADEAFRMLVTNSQRRNVKLVTVAHEVVETVGADDGDSD